MEAVLSPTGSEGAGANGVPSPVFNIIDPSVIVEHLASVVTIALGATRAELESAGSILSRENHPDTVQRCSRFATDVQVALYIQKDVKALEDIPDGPSDNGKRWLQQFGASQRSNLLIPNSQSCSTRLVHIYDHLGNILLPDHYCLPCPLKTTPGDRSRAPLNFSDSDTDITGHRFLSQPCG
jgi:hypothetical protein